MALGAVATGNMKAQLALSAAGSIKTSGSNLALMAAAAKMGISSMLKGSKMVIHKVLKKLDDRSLAAILDFIEEIIHEPEAPAT